MQINKDIIFKKEEKIVIDYNPKTGNNWIRDFVKKIFDPPKKDLGKAKPKL